MITLALSGAWLGLRRDPPSQPQKSTSPEPQESTSPFVSSEVTSGNEVFQRAFWKYPTDEDKILHAEREEWSDNDGVAKWQWFIAVKPSSQLIAYLWKGNAFGLVPAQTAEIDHPPKWFPNSATGCEVRRSATGKMILLWNKSENTLYATDRGSGFRPGAPAAAPEPSSQNIHSGRIPPTVPE